MSKKMMQRISIYLSNLNLTSGNKDFIARNKIKVIIFFIFIVLLISVNISFVFAPETGILADERRTTTKFPKFPTRLRARDVRHFFRDIDSYYADKFPLRSFLLSANQQLKQKLSNNLDIKNCIVGKDNWLFLGNNYLKSVDKILGKIKPTEYEFDSKVKYYSDIKDKADNWGSQFVIFIGPNKSSVYYEYLPDIILPSKTRYITQLVDKLTELNINIFDPTNYLIENKKPDILYYRTDTHWNLLAGYKSFIRFNQWMEFPELPPLLFEEGPVYTGDLVTIGGFVNFPLTKGDNFILNEDLIGDITSEDEFFINKTSLTGKTAWVIGDSFTEALKPFFKINFHKVRFVPFREMEKFFDLGLEPPDFIIYVIVERTFF
jgi:hypothetical protein